MNSNHRLLAALPLLACIALAGCANPVFYNEARDKQGQALAQATKDLNLVGVVDGLDQRFAALRAMEVDTLKARQVTNRELEIAQVASSGADDDKTLRSRYVKPLLDDRIERLIGRPLGTQQLGDLLADAAAKEESFRVPATLLRAFNSLTGQNLSDCAGTEALANVLGELDADKLQPAVPADKLPSARAVFKALRAKCHQPNETFAGLKLGGQLDLLAKRRDTERQHAQAYDAALATQQQKLAVTLKEYDAEVAAITPKDPGALAKLAQAADKLKSKLDELRATAGGDSSALASVEAQARLKSLDDLLDAVSSGVTDPTTLDADQRRAVAIVRLIPSLTDEADKLLKNAQRPRLGPLLLAKEQQRLAVESFAAQAATLHHRADLRQQQLDAARDELFALARARLVLGPPLGNAKGVTIDLNQTVVAAMADVGQDGHRRAALYESFAYYFDYALLYRAQQAQLDLEADGLTDELVIQQSHSAALMWQALLTNMASVLGDYHAAGIKAADLAEFVKGLGVFYVGYQAGK